jgi:DNA (cytosine-5)-methyltransferase 1
MTPLTVGSLFSGIGGFEFGLERTGGFKTVWQCEIDPFCLKVLAKHWPDVKRFTDIKRMGVDEEIPCVDVICGGFPCQDISCAGKGAGIHAERSGLWWEMLRIIRLVRPRFVLVENVAALLNRGLDEVLGSLAESGYDAEWQVLSADMFGAPHKRRRMFIIAYPSDRRTERGISSPGNAYPNVRRGGRKKDLRWETDEPMLYRSDDGLPKKLHRDQRLRALGNAIVPQCAQFVGQCLLDFVGEVDA